MDQLVSDLTAPASRVFLYVPNYFAIEQPITQIIPKLLQNEPNVEIALVTMSSHQNIIDNVSNFQMGQINQNFFNIFFGLDSPRPTPPRILIIEASKNLSQFFIPRKIGRILVLGSSFKSIDDLTITSRFLSGLDDIINTINPLQVGIFLGQIGYQLTSPRSETNIVGLNITINVTELQYEEYIRQISGNNPSSALQVLNLIYPPHIQLLYNLSREQRPNIIPDLPIEDGGWISKNVNLKETSPKIDWLINYLRINPGKHVIYSAFTSQAISSFLRIYGFSVVYITGNERQQDRTNKLNNFNGFINQVILISNLYAFNTIKSASSLILFEQHPNDNIVNSYLKQIINPGSLFINNAIPLIFLIGIGPKSQTTLDVSNYIHMAKLVNQKDAILKFLRTGQFNPSELQKYRESFGIPNITIEYLTQLFKDIKFRPIPVS